MKDLIGRLIAYLFLGSFCLAGPLLLIAALATAAQRAELIISGLRVEATVIGARQSGSTRVTYAPVFQFMASDGRTYTVSSDVYGKESAVRYGKPVQVLYWPEDPQSARIKSFATLWTLPLVIGVVGAGFCVVPAIVLVAWMRRRAGEVEPDKRAAAGRAADRVSRGLRGALGLLLIGIGGFLLALGLGVISADSNVHSSRIPIVALAVLLVAAGVQVGQWAAPESRLSYIFGGIAITSMAVMFGWVALCGDSANFHSGLGTGGAVMASRGSVAFARILFALVSILAGLAAVRAWKQAFRRRDEAECDRCS